MHEFAITQSVLDIALEHAKNSNANKITRINLVVGEMTGIVDECVRFYFDIISKDTIASEATLSFEIVPTQAHCRHCDTTFTLNGLDSQCPSCHGYDIEMIAGRELYVESIEVE